MSNNDYEELDGLDGSEGDNTDETNNDSGEENGTPDNASKNKSNFKKLSEALKTERSEKARIQAEKEEMEEELKAWRTENAEVVNKALEKKNTGNDKGELALFLVVNPEAKSALKEVQEFAKNTGFNLEDSWKYVKPTLDTESKDSKDFDLKSRTPSKKIDLKSMSIEEAYSEGKLSKEQRSEWRKLHESA